MDILSSIPVPFVLTDDQGHVTYGNDKMIQCLPQECFMDQPLSSFVERRPVFACSPQVLKNFEQLAATFDILTDNHPLLPQVKEDVSICYMRSPDGLIPVKCLWGKMNACWIFYFRPIRGLIDIATFSCLNEFLYYSTQVYDAKKSLVAEYFFGCHEVSAFDSFQANWININEKNLVTRVLKSRSNENQQIMNVLNSEIDALLFLNADCVIEKVNPAALKLLQYPQEEIAGKHIEMIIPTFRNVDIGDNSNEIINTKVVSKTGEVLLARLSARKLCIGDEVKYSLVIQDVSETIDYKTKIDTLVRAIVHPLVIITSSGIIRRVNPALLSFLGYTENELLGQNVKILMPAQFSKNHDHYVKRFLETNQRHILGQTRETVAVHKNGSIIHIELSVNEVKYHNRIDFIGMMKDITLSRLVEKKTREFTNIFESAIDPIFVINSKGIIEKVNKSGLEIFGYSMEELLGHNINIIVPEPYKSHHDSFISSYMSTKVRKVIGIGRKVMAVKKDGTEFPIELSVSEFYVEGEVKFTGIIRDVTDREKAIEDKILAEKKASASQAEMNMRSQFFALMSHEIRTPLNGILGMITMIMEDAALTSDQLQYANIIYQSGSSLLQLLNNYLDSSKIEVGKMSLEIKPMNLAELCISVVELFQHAATEKANCLYLFYASDVPKKVYGDSHRFRQVLTNLIGNAIKFTKEGTIILRVTNQGEKIAFSVEDSGIGMSDEDQKNTFQDLYVTKPSISGQYGGTGLGLYITNKLINLMGGTFTVESRLNYGSKFFVNIPFQTVDDDRKHEKTKRGKGNTKVLFKCSSKTFSDFIEFSLNGVAEVLRCSAGDLKAFEHVLLEFKPHFYILENLPGNASDYEVLELLSKYKCKLLYIGIFPDGLMKDSSFTQLRYPLSSIGLRNLITKEEDKLAGLLLRSSVSYNEFAEKDLRTLNASDILVVDDNLINQKVISTMLRKVGVSKISFANNGKEAVDFATSHKFDLIFMDLLMPVMDGWEAIDLIRKYEYMHAEEVVTPIIALTALSDVALSQSCKDHKIQGHLLKPIQKVQLIETLDHYILHK